MNKKLKRAINAATRIQSKTNTFEGNYLLQIDEVLKERELTGVKKLKNRFKDLNKRRKVFRKPQNLPMGNLIKIPLQMQSDTPQNRERSRSRHKINKLIIEERQVNSIASNAYSELSVIIKVN